MVSDTSKADTSPSVFSTRGTGGRAPWLTDLINQARIKIDGINESKPLTAKGGRKVIIRTSDETIEYCGGRTKVEGLITPTAQDELEPRLEALAAERDGLTRQAAAVAEQDRKTAKADYEALMNNIDATMNIAVDRAISTYEQSAREAILAASGK